MGLMWTLCPDHPGADGGQQQQQLERVSRWHHYSISPLSIIPDEIEIAGRDPNLIRGTQTYSQENSLMILSLLCCGTWKVNRCRVLVVHKMGLMCWLSRKHEIPAWVACIGKYYSCIICCNMLEELLVSKMECHTRCWIESQVLLLLLLTALMDSINEISLNLRLTRPRASNTRAHLPICPKCFAD